MEAPSPYPVPPASGAPPTSAEPESGVRPTAPTSLEAQLADLRAPLCAAARRLVPASEVEDLVQDALARALTHRERFDPSRPPLPWLRRILVHLHFDRLRQRAARPECEALPESTTAAPPRLDAREQLDYLFDQLDEPGRTLLRRFHQGGESIAALAKELGMPTGTIKSHLHRARRELARRFTLGPDATVQRRIP